MKLGVNPNLISTRLLSKEDKEDMLRGLINEEALETAVKCWVASGMLEYARYKPRKPSCDFPAHEVWWTFKDATA